MKTKAELQALSNTTFPTNGTRSITAEAHRNFNNESIDAMYLMPGSVISWAGLNALIPAGWHLCDGTQLSQTTYAALFTALGGNLSPWGVQATTFSLPNIYAKSTLIQPIVANENVVDAPYKLGLRGGEETHQLTENEMPGHSHKNGVVDDVNWPFNYGATTVGVPGTATKCIMTDQTEAPLFQGITSIAGNNAFHNNMPPYACMYYIIRLY